MSINALGIAAITDFGITGVITLIILALTVVGFIKGLIRTLLALVCLAVAGYAALWGHEHTPDFNGSSLDYLDPWLPKIAALITGLVVFSTFRFLLRFVIKPFDQSSAGKKIGFGIPAATLSLCMGLALIWITAAGIRYTGSLGEIRYTHTRIIDFQNQEKTSSKPPLLVQAKDALDSTDLGKWHQKTDPFYTPLKVDLCKLLILYHQKTSRAALLKDPSMNPVVNAQAFLELAYQKPLLNAAQEGSSKTLFHSPILKQFVAGSQNNPNKQLHEYLNTLNLEQFMAQILRHF